MHITTTGKKLPNLLKSNKLSLDVICQIVPLLKEQFLRGRGGGTPLLGLFGDVPLDRVWFFGLAVLNRVYNLTCLFPKQGHLS